MDKIVLGLTTLLVNISTYLDKNDLLDFDDDAFWGVWWTFIGIDALMIAGFGAHVGLGFGVVASVLGVLNFVSSEIHDGTFDIENHFPAVILGAVSVAISYGLTISIPGELSVGSGGYFGAHINLGPVSYVGGAVLGLLFFAPVCRFLLQTAVARLGYVVVSAPNAFPIRLGRQAQAQPQAERRSGDAPGTAVNARTEQPRRSFGANK